MIYQNPLAYLLGLEGLALLRAWGGDFDEGFVRRRLAEVQKLLDAEALAGHDGVLVARNDTRTGYAQWAAGYDTPRNSLFDFDEPVMHEIIDALPPGEALDACCGTGRYAEYLAGRGHRVIGVDSSPDMLERARQRVPSGDFREADIRTLPLPDRSVDLVVSALALTHLPDLGPVLAEFARVLRPGGSVVISEAHCEIVVRGSVPHALGPDGEPGLTTSYRHRPGDYVRAALAAGLQVRRCEEPGGSYDQSPPPPPPAEYQVGDWADWPWSLLELIPEASRAAWAVPSTIIWHFARPS
ncbi:class I SAM-dependent methyltransferase [Dactylosporangium sp. NPDC051541]|uniref:class I SAM-dependent methyltransferase n=1 Tax=Dactylosporangium sp. NPDC051541 TaxID=3363977 RepID=UPI003791FCD9